MERCDLSLSAPILMHAGSVRSQGHDRLGQPVLAADSRHGSAGRRAASPLTSGSSPQRGGKPPHSECSPVGELAVTFPIVRTRRRLGQPYPDRQASRQRATILSMSGR